MLKDADHDLYLKSGVQCDGDGRFSSAITIRDLDTANYMEMRYPGRPFKMNQCKQQLNLLHVEKQMRVQLDGVERDGYII